MKKLLPLLFLSGCTSYSLRPDPGPGEFRNGREYRLREIQGVKVAVALEEYRSGESTFRVSVENGSAGKFDLMPSAVSCFSGSGEGGVVDPERRLAELRSREESLEPSGLETTGRLLDETSILLTSFSSSEKDRRLRADAEAREADYEAREKERAVERARLAVEKQYWADHVLRRTTLAHGESVSGDVVCRTPSDYHDLIVRLAMPGGSADFHFERYEVD